MTAYIPPIDKPEAIYTIHVLRYNPEDGKEPRWESYQVPWVKTMTVMEALEYQWDQGNYIAFRGNCREFTCGSCAMLINGRPSLACDTPLENHMHIQPLARYPVVRDLVVQTGDVKKKWRELELWPNGENIAEGFKVSHHTLESYRDTYSRCIECYCCLEACPASHNEASPFDGPMWMLQIARAREHPLDRKDRTQQASKRGMWLCVNCYQCENVCPVNISPIKEIQRLRSRAVVEKIQKLFRLR